MFIAQLFKANLLKKIRSVIFIVWVLGKVEKNQKKTVKNARCNTCFLILFSSAFKNKGFRYLAEVTNLLFTQTGLFSALYPALKKYIFYKKILLISIRFKSINFTVIY